MGLCPLLLVCHGRLKSVAARWLGQIGRQGVTKCINRRLRTNKVRQRVPVSNSSWKKCLQYWAEGRYTKSATARKRLDQFEAVWRLVCTVGSAVRLRRNHQLYFAIWPQSTNVTDIFLLYSPMAYGQLFGRYGRFSLLQPWNDPLKVIRCQGYCGFWILGMKFLLVFLCNHGSISNGFGAMDADAESLRYNDKHAL